MTYLAIYFAIGIIFAAYFGSEMENPHTGILAGFIWPVTVIWFLYMMWVRH